MRNLMRISFIFGITGFIYSCESRSKERKEINETENQIDETIQKTNELKYGRPSSRDSTNEDVDYLIDQEKER